MSMCQTSKTYPILFYNDDESGYGALSNTVPKLAFHNRNDNEILDKEFSSAGPRTFVFFLGKAVSFKFLHCWPFLISLKEG